MSGAPPVGVDYFLDDVAIGAEPACPSVANVIDGDFETPSLAQSWQTGADGGQALSDAAIVRAADGHGGQAYASLHSSAACAGGQLTQSITVPSPEPGRGPALKFWYRTGAASADVLVSVTNPYTANVLPAAAEWTQKTVCLGPYEFNRPTDLSFTIRGKAVGHPCGDAIPTETLSIDDVEITTDSSCPTT